MAITLTDIASNKIFQRSNGSADVTISGTYTGTPTNIEYRIVDDGTDTPITSHDWTTLEAGPSGGVFSGVVSVAQGGFYNIDVRFSNDHATIDNGVNAWGVGVLVGCIGQSNVSRWFWNGTDLTADPLLKVYTDSAWEDISTLGNGAISFGNTIIDQLSIPVGLLDSTVGGSALIEKADASYGYWLDTAVGEPYDLFTTAVDDVGGALEFIVWAQGEQESHVDNIFLGEYERNLTYFLESKVRNDVNNSSQSTNLPILISLLGKSEKVISNDEDSQIVRDAQKFVHDTIDDTYIVSTIDFDLQADDIHFTYADYITHGERCAQAFLVSISEASSYLSPRISKATKVSTTQIDINITHGGGTDFTPTTGITGFEVFDGVTPVSITSTARQNSTTIRLTLDSTITGTPSVRYLYGANPAVTSQVFDNATNALPLFSVGNIEFSPSFNNDFNNDFDISVSGSTITGSGSPQAEAATGSGAGLRKVTGSGSVQPDPSTTSSIGLRLVKGSGSPQSETATVTASGSGVVSGSGSPQSNTATANGLGLRLVSGSGGPQCGNSTAEGLGLRVVIGSGTPQGDNATSNGLGLRLIIGSGDTTASTSTATGTNKILSPTPADRIATSLSESRYCTVKSENRVQAA